MVIFDVLRLVVRKQEWYGFLEKLILLKESGAAWNWMNHLERMMGQWLAPGTNTT